MRKIIGIEGDIALKNMKRNKRKYRITMVSLFISVVLFISFSTLLTYVTVSSTTFFNDVDFDIYLEADDEDKNLLNRTINDIINTSEVEKSVILRQDGFLTNSITDDDYHKDYLPIFEKLVMKKIPFGQI